MQEPRTRLPDGLLSILLRLSPYPRAATHPFMVRQVEMPVAFFLSVLYCSAVETNMEYEFIREIFNPCAGNAHPQVSVSEVDTDHVDSYVQQFLSGKD